MLDTRLIDKIPVNYLSLNADGKIIHVNQKFCETTGYSENEVQMRFFTNYLSEKSKTVFAREYPLVLKTGISSEIELELIHKNRGLIHAVINCWPEKDKNEKLLLAHCVLKDISPRFKIKDQLIESEDKLRKMLDSASVGITMADESGKMIEWNHYQEVLSGYKREEILGVDAWEVNFLMATEADKKKKSKGELRKMFLEYIKSHDAPQLQKSFEIEIVSKNGETRHVLQSPFVIRTRSGEILTGSINQDINKQKAVEKHLRDLTFHVESIRENERKMIAREIHDELGQSLTAIKMDLAMIGKRIQEDKIEEVDKILTESSQLLEETMDEVRQLSSRLRPGILDDLGLIAALEWQAGDFTKRSGIPCNLQNEAGDIEPEGIIATAIFRIFQEVLTNIMRHSKARNVDVFIEKTQDHIIFEVRDNGVGIKKENIHDKKSYGIIGMKERAHYLGGMLDISGEKGKGTRVKVRMPLK